MGFKYKVEPSQESLWTRITYALTKDTTCAAKIKDLVKKLHSDRSIDLVKVSVGKAYPFELMKKLVQFMDKLYTVSAPIVKLYLSSYSDSVAENPWKTKKLDILIGRALIEAGKKIGPMDSVKAIEASLQTKLVDKPLGQLGYTTNNLVAIASLFDKMVAGNKDVLSMIEERNSDWDASAFASDNDPKVKPALNYLKAMSFALKVYKEIDYFLFKIERAIKA